MQQTFYKYKLRGNDFVMINNHQLIFDIKKERVKIGYGSLCNKLGELQVSFKGDNGLYKNAWLSEAFKPVFKGIV